MPMLLDSDGIGIYFLIKLARMHAGGWGTFLPAIPVFYFLIPSLPASELACDRCDLAAMYHSYVDISAIRDYRERVGRDDLLT